MGPLEWKFATLVIMAVIGALLVVWGASMLKSARGKGLVEAEGAGFKLKAANYGPGIVVFIIGFGLLAVCATRTFSQTKKVTKQTTVVENTVEANQIVKTVTTTTIETEEVNGTAANVGAATPGEE